MDQGAQFIMEMQKMLDCINDALVQIDECFAANDTNNALKKTHEAISIVRAYKDALGDEHAL